MRSLIFSTLLLISGLEAQLEDHFKKIEDKSSIHSMRNIDFIYLINLERRPERLEKALSLLEPYEIYPYHFSAVDGSLLTVEDMQDIGLKYTKDMKRMLATTYLTEDRKPTHQKMKEGRGYFREGMTFGMVGCLLSHLSILQDAYDSEYATIWVLEDDISIIRDPRILSDLIDELDKTVGQDWDVLFTDRDFRSPKGKYERCTGWSPRPNFKPSDPERFKTSPLIGKTFRRVGARFGTHSMIIRRSGMKKILDFIKTYQPFNPYDLDMYLPEDIKMYSVAHDVVSNEPSRDSDTGSK